MYVIAYTTNYFTYRVLSYTYSMTHSSGFVIFIPDKRTTNAISWYQMDTHVVLTVLTVSHPHLMVFVAVACCLGHAKNSD